MTIPTTVIQKNREYVLVKEYDTYVRYKDAITGCMVCFNRHELGLVEETVKPQTNINLIGRRKL